MLPLVPAHKTIFLSKLKRKNIITGTPYLVIVDEQNRIVTIHRYIQIQVPLCKQLN